MVDKNLSIYEMNNPSHGFDPVTINVKIQGNNNLVFIKNVAYVYVHRISREENSSRFYSATRKLFLNI